MKVEEIMSTRVETCRVSDTVERAAQIMWEADCGVVPVIDADSHVVGVITDRDVCMAAYTQGKPLWQIPVSSVCSHKIYACKLNDSLQTAENIMRVAQVRRVPVVDDEGKLWGLVSLGDLAQHVHRGGGSPDGLSYASVALTLAAISQPAAELPNGKESTGPLEREPVASLAADGARYAPEQRS
jgi:CBS domain-containing protein